MTPSQLVEYLVFAIEHNFPVLVKGKPGIGKSEVISQAVLEWGVRNQGRAINLIITHPVVSDPTDFKGLPFPKGDGTADFLPYGELQQLITASEKTVCFLDDLGQAPASVQAACMQLLLARKINGHQISPNVIFIAATNRREDKAAVSGLLEPVKSRFAAILELDVNVDDWVNWALKNDMPTELIAFIRFRPEVLDQFKPSKDMVNSPCPRTIAYVGKQQVKGIPQGLETEVFQGAAGEAFAQEYTNFLRLCKSMPSIDEIILRPDKAAVSDQPSILYAVTTALSRRANEQNIGNVCSYLDRLPPEFSVACIKNAVGRNPKLCNTRDYINWAVGKGKVLI